jgi:hypothetical protein
VRTERTNLLDLLVGLASYSRSWSRFKSNWLSCSVNKITVKFDLSCKRIVMKMINLHNCSDIPHPYLK